MFDNVCCKMVAILSGRQWVNMGPTLHMCTSIPKGPTRKTGHLDVTPRVQELYEEVCKGVSSEMCSLGSSSQLVNFVFFLQRLRDLS